MSLPPAPADPYHPAPDQPAVDQGRLWIGGFVTAVVVAILTLVAWWVVHDVLQITAVPPLDGDAATSRGAVDDAIGVFVGALLATVLLDALLLVAPTPLRFFTWLVGLVTAILVIAPWTTDGDLAPKVARSVTSALVGAVLCSLLTGAARRSLRLPGPTRW